MADGNGICLLTQGTKCIIRLLVSLSTLRNHYKGPVTVVCVGDVEDWFAAALKDLNADMLKVPNDGMAPLVRKAHLWQISPYDCTVFLDADTIVLKPVTPYFDQVRAHTFTTGAFSNWVTSGSTMSKRIKAFGKICPEYVQPALDYGKATNTGIFGFVKNAPILKEWAELTQKAYDNEVSRIPDEVACQMLLPKYPHWLAPEEWGMSVKHSTQPDINDINIIHYHGFKHASAFPLCTLWKSAFWAYYHSSPPERQKELLIPRGDRRFKRYMRHFSQDITVVTAVDQAYLPCLKENFPKWMRTEGLCEYKWICYYNGLDPSELDFMRGRTKLIPWDLPNTSSQREKMLSAFVLGAAKNVTTNYWIKIDTDVKPMDVLDRKYDFTLSFPRSAWKCSLSGHSWNYTKPGQFLVDLEEWADKHPAFAGTAPVFDKKDYPIMRATKRYGHKRIASYICLHKSDFVRKAAEAAGNRLPCPSHDSYLWYCAARWKLPIARLKFKPAFIP